MLVVTSSSAPGTEVFDCGAVAVSGIEIGRHFRRFVAHDLRRKLYFDDRIFSTRSKDAIRLWQPPITNLCENLCIIRSRNRASVLHKATSHYTLLVTSLRARHPRRPSLYSQQPPFFDFEQTLSQPHFLPNHSPVFSADSHGFPPHQLTHALSRSEHRGVQLIAAVHLPARGPPLTNAATTNLHSKESHAPRTYSHNI